MSGTQKLSPATLTRIARDLLGTPLAEQDLEAVAALLRALTSEMAPMRAMEILDVEPAVTYDPRQP